MSKNKISQKAYSSLVVSAVLWGLTPFVYKKSLALLSILLFLALRFTIGAVTIFVSDRKRFVKLSSKTILSLLGLCMLEVVFSNYAYSYGIQRTSIIHASLIQLSIPFLVYIFAAIILKEKVHRIVWVGGAIAALGLAVTIIPKSSGDIASAMSLSGDIALLAQVIATSFGIVIARKILSRKKHQVPPEQFGFIEYGFASIFFVSLLIINGGLGELSVMASQAWIWVIIAGTVAGAIPMRLYYRSVKRLPAERIADANFISPAVAMLTGIILLNENLNIWSVMGLALVIIGLLVSHQKIHPVYIAHQLNLHAGQLSRVYRIPKRAYAYIRYQ